MSDEPVIPISLRKGADILEEARKIVYGRGEKEYGHPRDNFGDLAKCWTAYLHARKVLPRGQSLGPRDVAQMFVLTKVIRDGNQYKHDNLVDQIGYTLTAYRVEEE